jgi:CO/xanthine dehydrogenase Mo-binding subunit
MVEKTSPAVEEVQENEAFETIGKSVPHVEAKAKVRGRLQYSSDFSLPDMLWGKILFSERPHARILRLDVSKARALPGVVTVITGSDAPHTRIGSYTRDRLIFATEKVRYAGEPMAAVAAVSEKIAAQAIGLIEVEYEDLPAVFTVEDALQPDAPLVHPAQDDYFGIYPYVRYGNVSMDAKVSLGDVDQQFAAADMIIEDTYRTQPQHAVAIEPHACVASFDDSDRLTVWTGTQQLSVCHFELGLALEMPMSEVRVIPLWIGGGFGGKLNTLIEPIVALLALKADRPVKIVLTREEELIAAHSRPPFTMRLKTGVMKDGTIVGHEADILVDTGGYADHALGTAAHAVSCVQGAYHIPHCRGRARSVYTNNSDWGCVRGYGTVQITFATEVHMNAVARAVDMDPVEFRMQNLGQEGDQWLSTQRLRGVQIRKTMQKALEAAGYWEKKGRLGPNRGIGVSNLMKTAGLLSSSASVKVNEDGTVSVITAITDIGSGTHTVICQLVAETLGIPVGQVHIAAQDSDSSPYDTGSIASRTTFDAGNAARLAAEDVRAQMIEVAAETWGCAQSDVLYQGGRASRVSDPEAELPFEALVGISMYARKGPFLGHGRWIGETPFEEKVGEGYPEGPYPTWAYGTHVVEVEVDPDTGQTKVLNFTACHDVGRALNPKGLEGQVEGGVVQGIGYGLYEEMIMRDGVLQNPNMVDYKIPTSLDVPRIESSFVEVPDAKGPFGAKGIGEHPILGPAPALINAIEDATGVALREIPASVERLYYAMREAREA